MTEDVATPRRRQSKEHIEQTKFVMKVRTFHPDILCMSIPNGAAVSSANRMRLVHEGMMAGAPDLLLFLAGKPVLAIEMKTKTGKTSAAQVACHEAMKKHGVTVELCRSSDEAYDAVINWMSR